MSLCVKDLAFAYGEHTVLDGISFEAENGSLLAVLGGNGEGKTTLFRCILGLNEGYRGDIRVDGLEARSLSPYQASCHMAYIPQLHTQIFSYTVFDMVLMGTTHQINALSSPGRKEEAKAWEAIKSIGITALADKSYDCISGGEQQLTLIARALAQGAGTLIMDEPTASLDYGNQIKVLKTIRGLADNGYAVILSTHNPQQALSFADKALALSKGKVLAHGRTDEVITPKTIKTLYHLPVSFVKTDKGVWITPEREEGN